VFFDVASAELFADDGANVMTEIFFPTMDYSHMSLYSNGAGARVLQGRVFQLTGIWQ
jgi:fructan beta-fructosidase